MFRTFILQIFISALFANPLFANETKRIISASAQIVSSSEKIEFSETDPIQTLEISAPTEKLTFERYNGDDFHIFIKYKGNAQLTFRYVKTTSGLSLSFTPTEPVDASELHLSVSLLIPRNKFPQLMLSKAEGCSGAF